MQEVNTYLSGALKKARKDRNLSLDKAAKATGVSKAMLGQIERGESSPTLATLWKIASGLNLSMSGLLGPALSGPPTVFRNADALREQPTQDRMLVATLFPFNPALGFEMFELTLLPGYERYSEPHEPGVTEHVVVIEGEVEIFADDQWQKLAKGDAIRFAADRPHGYRNLSNASGVFHNLIHYPPR
ncbi:helix-turn-helix domain-containing protein [Aliamphritea hakodatensis]|uniref:helix-turn-helix domain-containing protein n=1 Tax=Aliamphritea hakodatensis TaxID=2895352 RepID=UPI0022FD87C1|nr:helix-turn-helix domain-containing protein [Aliamphritea hakodatensis]